MHLGFLRTVFGSPVGLLASRLGHRGSGIAHNRTHLGLLLADLRAHSSYLLLLGEGGQGVTEEKLASLSLTAGFPIAPLSRKAPIYLSLSCLAAAWDEHCSIFTE